MDLGEFALIDCIRNQYKVPEGFLGIGDDCAVIPQRDGLETLLTTDMLMEGVHFLLDDVNPYSLGWKSAAVNISDIAGMGGKPVASFLSFALPKKLSDTFLKEFLRGYKDLSDRFDSEGIPHLHWTDSASALAFWAIAHRDFPESVPQHRREISSA